MSSLAQAIANFEGFGVSSSNLPTKNNNPGDIVYGSFASKYGAVPDPNSQFAIFPSSSVGFQALNDLLSSPGYASLSLGDAISKWNGNGTNSSQYANYVANQTGYSVNDTVSDILAGSQNTNVLDNFGFSDSGIPSYFIWVGIGLAGIILLELI